MSDSDGKNMEGRFEAAYIVDLVRLILERLSFVDFHRARCVSSTWYVASKSVIGVTNPTTPWIILFPNKNVENNGSCKLFDPHENKTYIIRDLGFDMSTSRCLASSGSWFLMFDHRADFHLLNLFTRERILLPSLESIDGERYMRFKRPISGSHIEIDKAVLWVDDKSRDYFVFCNLSSYVAYHHKRGDDNNSWKVLQPIKHQGCVDMVFKESKLYMISAHQCLTVFDFSGGVSPVEMECASFGSSVCVNRFHMKYFSNLAVTLSGEVLIIVGGKMDSSPEAKCVFTVNKMDPKSSEFTVLIKSIGDEALLLDLGITVPAKDGVMRDCIYFSNDQYHRCCGISLRDGYNADRICVYQIGSDYVVQEFEHLTTSSTKLFKDARWFFPTFGDKCCFHLWILHPVILQAKKLQKSNLKGTKPVTREKTTIVNNVDGTTTQREKTTKGKNMIGKK
ncbi:Hypothetical protein [Arabidopsis thaliana]|uniref:F-box protein KIB3 n=1 Tax=Arabidopsis thaliana TaxID=3702 RepID=KIB3_ARATH|nr:F-box/kelch-repeat protein, putative (DUF295) [Arabidopsis thaliana]Q9ZW91.1 RecName: Full=F-box protein KIB3; AltName: Full=Protein KINK SUPPRESSED IN BZR1-1D 3 [Arabidopsis thaliana]AAD10661.1 Hypothetical protein [Arabidopsis thaliana]AEE34607.1 F-box/kelch-repeat protein, putative (DUF295) [Arabidopsis thaliana]|eukprot:NP_176887.1 F-box/kelch-repeat protein, putative (DUF295) [Arabidopsis thaliana]